MGVLTLIAAMGGAVLVLGAPSGAPIPPGQLKAAWAATTASDAFQSCVTDAASAGVDLGAITCAVETYGDLVLSIRPLEHQGTAYADCVQRAAAAYELPPETGAGIYQVSHPR